MKALPEIVVFDLGGVLVRIHRSPQDALRAVGFVSEAPVEFSDPIAYAHLNQRYQSGLVPLTDFIDSTRELLSAEVPAEVLLAAHDQILIEQYQGALEVVTRLQNTGVQTCVLSNTCARHWVHLERFSAVEQALKGGCFLSFELGLVKPSPAIYECVQSRLGLAPERIGFVDDSVENVQSARAMGWRAVEVPYERNDSIALEAALGMLGFTG